MRQIKILLPILILITAMLACSSSSQNMQEAVTQLVATAVQVTAGNLPSTQPPIQVTVPNRPTYTIRPTDTVGPTNTPSPSETPEPTFTATPAPQPIELKGKGSKVVDVQKWDGPAIVHLVYKGSSNFIVTPFDANGETTGFMGLANEIGNYDGWKPLDFGLFGQNELTTRLQIKSSGDWTITICPLTIEYLKIADVPGTYQGKGDEVVFLKGGTPDLATFDYKGKSNFIVETYSSEGDIDGIVNEIGVYNGQVIVPNDTIIFVVTASGPWTVEITSK
jgi:hypothetical protein